MVALEYDPRFGGSPTVGDAVAGLGRDCVISLGGGPGTYAITQIIATYSSPFGLDHSRGAGTTGPAPNAIRSLTGRLAVLTGPRLNESFSNGNAGGVPNPILFNGFPLSYEVVYDQFIHNLWEPFVIEFPSEQGVGAIRNQPGSWLNTILVCPTVFSDPGGIGNNELLFSGLHVNAIKVSDEQSDVRLGAYRASK